MVKDVRAALLFKARRSFYIPVVSSDKAGACDDLAECTASWQPATDPGMRKDRAVKTWRWSKSAQCGRVRDSSAGSSHLKSKMAPEFRC